MTVYLWELIGINDMNALVQRWWTALRPSRNIMLGAVFTGCLIGCGCNEERKFVPSEETAEGTLQTALLAWKNGKSPPAQVQASSPAVQLVDTHYQPGQKLVAFTVLGPTTGDAERCYAVRLTMDNPREEIRVRFVVLGLDPLWVMRYEDFERVAHWEMNMAHEKKAER
jgi:hypothetical protein